MLSGSIELAQPSNESVFTPEHAWTLPPAAPDAGARRAPGAKAPAPPLVALDGRPRYREFRIALDRLVVNVAAVRGEPGAADGHGTLLEIRHATYVAAIEGVAPASLHLLVTGRAFDASLDAEFEDTFADAAQRLTRDPIVQRLVRTLTSVDDRCAGLADSCIKSISLAILARLFSLQSAPEPGSRRKTTPLPKWRLKRVVEYVSAHYPENVTLAQLAQAAGLTRMHFAAQFRAATGLRPHEYLLRRRIERAQEMLMAPNAQLVEIALSVGFQTQAHFTTVFKRFVGETPHRWRQTQSMSRMRSAA